MLVQTGPRFQGVKDTVLCRKVVVAVPIKVLVSVGGFPVSNVLLGPRKAMGPLKHINKAPTLGLLYQVGVLSLMVWPRTWIISSGD